MQKFLTLIVVLFASATAHSASFNNSGKYAVGQVVAEVELHNEALSQSGRYAFIAPKDGYLVEMDNQGVVTYSYKIPSPYNKRLNGAADVEVLPDGTGFLVVVPRTAVIQIDREKGLVWNCKTPYVSHDVDLLADSTIVFVNGWDDEGANEPVYTDMTKDCEVKDQLFAKDLGLDESKFHPDDSEYDPKRMSRQRPSHTHTNSVRVWPDGMLMLSIRNYDEFVLLKDRRVIKRYPGTSHVHDPVPINPDASIDEMEFYFAGHGRPHDVRRTSKDDSADRSADNVLWTMRSEPRKNRGLWRPIRTIEILPNKNILFSGSAYLAQITESGELVWKARINGFVNQSKPGNNIYKAAFVP